MPTYDYRCSACSTTFQAYHGIDEGAPPQSGHAGGARPYGAGTRGGGADPRAAGFARRPWPRLSLLQSPERLSRQRRLYLAE